MGRISSQVHNQVPFYGEVMNLTEWLAEAEKYRNSRGLLPLVHLRNGSIISIQNTSWHFSCGGDGFEVMFREGVAPSSWDELCEDPTNECGLAHMFINVDWWRIEDLFVDSGLAYPIFEEVE